MRRLLFLGSALLVTAVGCRSVAFTGSSAWNAPPTATLSGVVVANATETEFILADLREPTIQGVDLAIPLNTGDWVQTDQLAKVDVFQVYQGETYDYHAVIGPPASGRPAYWRFQNSEPAIQVERGWAFIWGRKVRTFSTMVTAAGEGTTIAIEVVSPTLKRLHLIRGTKATVTCGANSKDMLTQEQYVTIDSSCNISPAPVPIVGDPVVQPIIDRMKQIALAAGWDEN